MPTVPEAWKKLVVQENTHSTLDPWLRNSRDLELDDADQEQTVDDKTNTIGPAPKEAQVAGVTMKESSEKSEGPAILLEPVAGAIDGFDASGEDKSMGRKKSEQVYGEDDDRQTGVPLQGGA